MPDKTARTTANIPYFRSPEFKDVYSNNARIAASPFDFTILFGRMTEVGGGAALEDIVHVRMSPYQFKILVKYMEDTLASWEEVFGSLPANLPTLKKETILAGMKNMKEMAFKAP
jgi:Protein of unknown function (DUF3467)